MSSAQTGLVINLWGEFSVCLVGLRASLAKDEVVQVGQVWIEMTQIVFLYNEAAIEEAVGTMGSMGLGAWQTSGVLTFKPTGFVI